MATAAIAINLDYNSQKDLIKTFLTKFTVNQTVKYDEILTEVSKGLTAHIEVALDDLVNYDDTDELVNNIESNTKRFASLFCEVVDSLLPDLDFTPTDDSSPLEVLIYQRMKRNEQIRDEDANMEDPQNSNPMFPPALTRRYTLSFKPRSTTKQISVREIKGEQVGRMVKVKGIVTRISNVKPLAIVSAYSCDSCGNEVFQDITSQTWMPLTSCPSSACVKNNTKGFLLVWLISGRLHLQTRGCKFLRFQELKLQELTEQVPMGHIPRSMTVYLTEDQTRSVIPGEVAIISGVMLPIPFSGFKAMRAGLITDTYLEAHHVQKLKKQYSDMQISEDVTRQIEQIVKEPGVYDRLANSIAPEIYGHEDVKKALLLMLVGGTTKETADGMKVRGDLNICLMGDPGVAKSQLLKHICKIAPRAVYTTGRGSSGVGLTASVTRDPVTDEMVLEGGALVLADNGIACIDEFDKMDETDRTAIHEVMEQQTISISKAGITTTLNARTSILAAANPQYGRYNTKMKPTDNINLPAALLSRFDLLFLLLDKPSLEDDLRLAQHVTYVHRCLKHPKNENEDTLDGLIIKNYISVARKYNPLVPAHVGDYIVNAYVHLRSQAHETADFQYTCARTLLSIIRLASGLARLRFANEIQITDVDEALRLIEVSKSSLIERQERHPKDTTSKIFEIIKEMSTKSSGSMYREINLTDVRERIINKGFTELDLTRCIEIYTVDDVWMVTGADHSRLRWLRIEEDSDDDE
ncbi:MCM2/3/5 family-domain-containing protein [Globomyces pollinis-pini]|nr:MCM2/3/5 family-domain-containing protein [Globomyces pollinis-pini]